MLTCWHSSQPILYTEVSPTAETKPETTTAAFTSRSIFVLNVMLPINFIVNYRLSHWVSLLCDGLRGYYEQLLRGLPAYPTWCALLYCNSLEWNKHSSSLRLALHSKGGKQAFRRQVRPHKNRTPQQVQLRLLKL